MEKVIIDIGTGDGRFVYAGAKANPENLYIGVDPAPKQFEKYQKKINREKLANARFLAGSVENLPEEILGLADEVYINFPWGSLLGEIAKFSENIAESVSKVLKGGGRLFVVFGFSSASEPTETKRLEISEVSLLEVENAARETFAKYGLQLESASELQKNEIFEMESSWAKKLTFGKERKIYRLQFVKP